MASIVEFINKQGRKRWRVHTLLDGTMRHPEFRTFEEACHRVYQDESRRLHRMTPHDFLTMKDFTVRKVVWVYLGFQWGKVLSHSLSESSYREYERTLRSLSDTLLDSRVNRVSKEMIEQVVPRSGFGCLRAAFNYSLEIGAIAYNRCPKAARSKRKKVIPPPREAVQRVFEAAMTPQLKMFVFLCAVCGLRTGEALAVRRDDIRGNLLFVHHQLTKTGLKEGTKRNAGRTVPLPNDFFVLLAMLDERSPYLVYEPKRIGRPVNAQSFRTNRTVPMYREAKVTFSNHALRHFAAGNWIAEGRDVKVVQALLGHDDEATTMRVYGHLFNVPEAVVNTLDFSKSLQI